MKWLLPILFAAVHTLAAQTSQASISGQVTDPQGALLPGIRVTATHQETGVKTQVETNDTGRYTLRFLPIGRYTLTMEREGFRQYNRANLTLTTGQNLDLNVTLELGQVSEQVTVTAAAPLLESRTSDVSQLVETRTIQDMPIGDRNAFNIMKIVGASVFVNGQFSIAGGRTRSQMFWMDGGNLQNMRLGAGSEGMNPPIEALEEVKVLSNQFSAEYGASAGGIVLTNTRSGTNQFRGALFEFLRNDKLDAANFFAPVQEGRKVKPPLRYNVFGGRLGGPVRRDRTFFFATYEGTRRSTGNISTLTVPTALQRSGDFSQTYDARGQMVPVYDPATTRQDAGRNVRSVFPGNRIPAGRIDPVAAKAMPFFPSPNRAPDTLAGANNFRANYSNRFDREIWIAKLDHSFREADKVTVRYFYRGESNRNTSVYPEPAADTLNDSKFHIHTWFGSWTRVVTPAAVNDLRVSYSSLPFESLSKGLGGDWPSKLGLAGVAADAFPRLGPAGFAALGSTQQRRLQSPRTDFQFLNNLSWSRGRHSMKFGGEARRAGNVDLFLPTVSGNFAFSTLPTGQPGVAASGNGLATMLLGFPTSYDSRRTPDLDRGSWYLAWFAQDDWNVSKSLTLNIGIRWETDTALRDRNNRVNGFDPVMINPVSGTPGVVRFAGLDGFPDLPFRTDWNNFGPRFGFAWKPFGLDRTVVRGGFGIVYSHPFDGAAVNSAALGFEESVSLQTPDNGITAPFLLRDGVPNVRPTPPPLDASFGAVPVGGRVNTTVTFFEQGRRSGYSQQANFGVQHELPGQAVVEVRYLGNVSRKLPGNNLNMNQIRPERMGPAATQRDRPFPQFNGVTILQPALSNSAYHAGVVRFEKRFSGGLNILSTYTWSKNLNDNTEGSSTLGNEPNYSDFYNRRADWGPSANDVRHRLTWSSVYDLPFGRGKPFLGTSAARHVVGGWSIGAIATVQSGPPFTVTTLVDTTNAFAAGALRADALRNPNLDGGGRSLARWFDTGAFQQPAPYRFGNQGMGIVRADGLASFDFSILRNFAFGERVQAQFRGELFNAFNHPEFGPPGSSFGAPGFGVVASARDARQVQLGVRLLF